MDAPIIQNVGEQEMQSELMQNLLSQLKELVRDWVECGAIEGDWYNANLGECAAELSSIVKKYERLSSEEALG